MFQPSKPPASPASPAAPGEFSAEERIRLIRLAHTAIDAALEHRDLELIAPTDHLNQKRGAFTTLHLKHELRGCVGYVAAMYSVYRTVAETAVAAAMYDSRFYPVTRLEAAELEIEISILSPFRPIRAQEVVVGEHGLLISKNGHRGLLLPQVPAERGWDRESFLTQTCIKAGLPPDAWLRGATIQAFTAEIFSEKDYR